MYKICSYKNANDCIRLDKIKRYSDELKKNVILNNTYNLLAELKIRAKPSCKVSFKGTTPYPLCICCL